MLTDEVVSLGQELVAAWNAHDADQIAALHSSSFYGIDVGDSVAQQGVADVRRTANQYLRAFPDLHLTVEDSIVDDNRLVLVWSIHGTHEGTLMRIPPSGRVLQVRGVCVLTLEGGKIERAVHLWDVAGMLRAIGLLPDL
jgi:steroid delta-isomerase-like uncharacterized protein